MISNVSCVWVRGNVQLRVGTKHWLWAVCVCVCVCVRVCWERWPELRCETSDETREKQQHCPLGSTGVTSICSWREHTHPNPIYTWTHVCTQACTPVWHSTLCFQRSTFRAWMSQVYMPKLEGPFSACVTFLSDDGARQLRKPPVSDKSIRRELFSWLNFFRHNKDVMLLQRNCFATCTPVKIIHSYWYYSNM